MDDLIWRSLQRKTNAEEETALAQWRGAAPSNEQRYEELLALWDAASAVEPTRPDTHRPSTEEILSRADAREAAVGRRGRVGMSPRRWLAIGAAVAATVVLTIGMPQLLGGLFYERAQEVVTGADETASVRLADGSVVRLGPDSRLRLPHGLRAREVWLDGKAFFSIAKQEGRRFTVQSAAGKTTVLGTRFEMQTHEDDLRVLVVEGRVAVEAQGGRVEVGADEVSYVVEGAVPAVARVDNPRAMLDWIEGVLVFQDTPLPRVVEEIEAEYGVRIVLADPVLAERMVTAFFVDQPVEAVVAVICQVIDARCSLGTDPITMELPSR